MIVLPAMPTTTGNLCVTSLFVNCERIQLLTWSTLLALCLLLTHYSLPSAAYVHHRSRHREHSKYESFHSLCSSCPPGFGVAHRCTETQDTVCHSCPEGFYAPSHSRKHPCWPCSRCGEGLFEAHPCDSTKDTVCDACVNQHPHAGNTDYEEKCRDVSGSQHRNLLSTSSYDNNQPIPTLLQATTFNASVHFTTTLMSKENSTLEAFSSDANDEEVAVGVAQLAAFQVVLIFTAVAAILALTCRLRVCSSHESTRLKFVEDQREDGVALIEHLTES